MYYGFYEVEYMFSYSFVHWYCLIEDTENVGTGIRIDYGYSDANKFGVVKAWSDRQLNH
jgi:hypothetical protein